jgi:hypothetical protein
MGSKIRRGRWRWIVRAFSSGRIDSSLERNQDRAGLRASVSLAEESMLGPLLWNCWRKLQEQRGVAWWK